MNRKFVLGMCAAWGVSLCGLAVTIGNQPNVVVTEDSYEVATETLTTFPSGVPQPAFWIDASQTNDWTFAGEADADGCKVSVAPSLVGVNALQHDCGELDLGTATREYARLVPNAKLGGRNVLDFGPLGSKRSLWFASKDDDDKPLYKYIGTVVALYDSEDGGGALFSGCGPFVVGETSTNTTGQTWVRGTASGGSLAYVPSSYQWPIFGMHSAYVPLAARRSIVWHDGAPTFPQYNGFEGRWEVMAMFPEDNDVCTARGLGLTALDAVTASEMDYSKYSGGVKIAELMIFSETLNDVQIRLLETYLNAKWLGRKLIWSGAKAYNGTANVGVIRANRNASSVISVAAGDTLCVDSLQGGRGETEIVKTGAGKLVLGDASDFGGLLTLEAGETEIPLRAIPDELPEEALLDFDAETNVTEVARGGVNYVTRWDNALPDRLVTADGWTLYYDNNIWLREAETDGRTCLKLIEDPFLGGKKVIDFGPNNLKGSLNLTNSFIVMDKKTGTAMPESGETGIGGMKTLVWVADAKEGGGVMFGRSNSGSSTQPVRTIFTDPARQSSSFDINYHPPMYASYTNGLFYVNGVRKDTVSGTLDTADYAVVASHDFGYWMNYLGAIVNPRRGGGMKLGEVVAWRRTLTSEEMKDAQAFLAKKWLGKRLPGYADPNGATLEIVKRLSARPGAILNISGAGTVRVREVGTLRGLVKTGPGTLELPAAAGEANAYADLDVREGLVRFYMPEKVTALTERATNATFRADATETATLYTAEQDGTTYVRQWYDADGSRRCAFNKAIANCPWLNTTDTCNGHPVIDFGAVGSGRYMIFSQSLDDVRSLYVVLGSQNGGGVLLGNSKYSATEKNALANHRDFIRNGDGSSGQTLLHGATPSFVTAGENFIDGVQYTASAFRNSVPNGGYQLYEMHIPAGGALVSAFAADSDTMAVGGQRLGEVLLYNRELSPREKVATRNYLMKKWFGKTDDELTPLPAEEVPVMTFDTLRIADGATVDLSEVSYAAHAVKGSGRAVVKGPNTLRAVDMSEFTGTLVVSNATVELTGRAPRTALEPVLDGRIAHFDVADGLTVVTNSAGVAKVERWTSKLNDGWYAEPMHGDKGEDWKPHYLPGNGYDEMPAVQMRGPNNITGASSQDGPSQCLVFRDGVNEGWGLLTNIQSVVWVIGAHEGGGFILGGGYPNDEKTGEKHYNWHRGGNALCYDYTEPICGPRDDRLSGAFWWLNGTRIDPSNVSYPSADYHVVSMHPCDGRHSNAEGFAFDGRDWNDRNGYQRLQEVIVYNRALTDAERKQDEEYVAWKWRIEDIAEPADGASLVLAGGTLDLASTTNTFAGFGGSGTLTGGKLTVAETFAVDAADVAGLAVAGELVIADGVTFALTGFAADGVYVLARPTGTGAITLGGNCTVTGVPTGWRARVQLNAAGELVLKLHARKGFVLSLQR